MTYCIGIGIFILIYLLSSGLANLCLSRDGNESAGCLVFILSICISSVLYAMYAKDILEYINR